MTANELIEEVKKGTPLIYSTFYGSELYQLQKSEECSIMLSTSVAESVVKKLNLKKVAKESNLLCGMIYQCV